MTNLVLFVLALALGVANTMPEHNALNPSHVQDESLQEVDDDADWLPVGEEVEDTEPLDDSDDNEDDDDEQDVSDPVVLSDDLCPELMNVLHYMPENLTSALQNLTLDHPHGNRRCLRSRFYQCRGDTQRFNGICDRAMFSVIYRNRKYCCPRPIRRHPLVERRRRNNRFVIRCRC